MGIPKTYHDGNPEDRNYVDDFWSWLKEQPQQAWLYYARNANWDQADRIFVEMVKQPECDRALASWLFWFSEPRWHLSQQKRPHSSTLIGCILDRCAGVGFPDAKLHYHRVEVALFALHAAQALDELKGEQPFRIPRNLCASFEGDNPDLPAFDAETEHDLAEIFTLLDGKLPRSDRESLRIDHWWYKDPLRLPARPTVTEGMTDIQAIDAVFGEHRSALQRIERRRQKINARRTQRSLLGPPNPDLKQRALGLGLLALSGAGLLWVAARWIGQ